jgi:hypothetical protein
MYKGQTMSLRKPRLAKVSLHKSIYIYKDQFVTSYENSPAGHSAPLHNTQRPVPPSPGS